MSVTISRKLSSSFEGALAGGGDPATSPLYVFGPFLNLIVVAGIASVTFGATIWLAILTVFTVSAMYRQVMRWITDGSGGSGLSEEEFGGWAVKINAGITVIEYTLTFLVSMAALVTFIADRFPVLNDSLFGFQYRVFLALVLSFATSWIVNRGPKVSVRVFGPATAAVLLLLWGMIAATIYRTGFHLPDLNLQAFSLASIGVGPDGAAQPSFANFTFAGYARILALMTGIEVFANLVAAYDGSREERSKKAFGSLVIIMGTTAISMLILGPMIFAHTNALDSNVSVFTQAMDFLLPSWASYGGTLIGIVVLLSACAAAAQGVQNLALGLRFRHYIPSALGQRNKHDVASMPVWLMASIGSLCYFLFGTKEDTYLALYAAGVFVLLSMTGWAASKRLLREMKARFSSAKMAGLAGTIIAASLTSGATFVIFKERFAEGAWSYFVMVPMLYLYFTHNRRRLGPPPALQDWFGRVMSGEGYVPQIWYDKAKRQEAFIDRIVVPLNGSVAAEQVLPLARTLACSQKAQVQLLCVAAEDTAQAPQLQAYLQAVSQSLTADGLSADHTIATGDAATTISDYAAAVKADVIALTAGSGSPINSLVSGSLVASVIKKTLVPVLISHSAGDWHNRFCSFKTLLVALDGSESAESVLPYVRTLVQAFGSKVILLFVAEGAETDDYSRFVESYLNDVALTLRKENIDAETLFTGTDAVRTIVSESQELNVDLVMMASHGRGGTKRAHVHLGSVTEKVLREIDRPVFVVPLTQSGG